jgi:hypothetical protein
MQLAMTVGSVVLAGLVVVALIGFLFEKYAAKLDEDHAGSKEQDPAYTASKR